MVGHRTGRLEPSVGAHFLFQWVLKRLFLGVYWSQPAKAVLFAASALDASEKRGKDQARPIKRYTCEWQDIELGDWSPR